MTKDHLKIKTATLKDKKAIKYLWDEVIHHAFKHDQIESFLDSKDELDFKMEQLNHAFKSETMHYFTAYENHRLIGTIAYGTPPNRGILRRTNNALNDMIEIGSLYIHPDVQKSGYGRYLLLFILNHLDKQGIKEVCFDSIIETSKKIWSKMFGLPTYEIPSKKHDFVHMIWVVDIKTSIKRIENLEYK